jgi:glycine/serine hydroxymethyltransferase
VREIAEFVHSEFGGDNTDRPLMMYDAAHVLGLLGRHFQDPLGEGADIVTGSTHKTFFGPQRGVILSNIPPGSAFEPLWQQIGARTFPGHVSNHHLGTMLGLLGAAYEMLRFRDDYPKQVIRNARAFARALHDQGLSVDGDASRDFTETHQVLLRTERGQGEFMADLLEANNIITNPQALHGDPSFSDASGIRMGTQEMTRYGMKEGDFRELAMLMAEFCADGRADRTNELVARRSDGVAWSFHADAVLLLTAGQPISLVTVRYYEPSRTKDTFAFIRKLITLPSSTTGSISLI